MRGLENSRDISLLRSSTGLRNATVEIGKTTIHASKQSRASLNTLSHECKLLIKKEMIKRRW